MTNALLPSKPVRRAAALALVLASGLHGATALAADPAGATTAVASAPAASARPSTPNLGSTKDKTSYATGVMTARNLMKNEVEFDVDLLVQGLRDGMADGDGHVAMDEKELKKVLQAMQADMQRHITNERRVKGVIARERGQIFQKEYASKGGITVLPGNLLYRVVKAGDGPRPEAGSVVVRYKTSLVDGTVVDETPVGKTTTVKLNEVIPGWKTALQRMNAGSQWELVLPPSMAYGPRGNGDSIGPNETLVVQLELVALVDH